VEYKSKKSRKARVTRFLGRAVPAVVAFAALAGCGGGGGGDGGDRHAAPKDCLSTRGGGSGYALGTCADQNHGTIAHVFQPIDSLVEVRSTSGSITGYYLQLTVPSHLSQALSETAFEFGPDNRTPLIKGGPHRERSILGLLEGAAYEGPGAPTSRLAFPYWSIADFSQAAPLDLRAQAKPLQYANFGIWERFPTTDPNEGYMGVWFAERDGLIKSVGPDTAVDFVGNAVGVVGSDLATAAQPVREGLSARVTIKANGTGILGGQISSLFVSRAAVDGTLATTEEIKIDPIVLGPSVDARGKLQGSVTTTPGPERDILEDSGEYEARFFSKDGQAEREIAGQIRFATSDGLVIIGAFGVRHP